MGEQRLAGQSGGKDRGGGREQKDAPAPVGEKDQEPERDQNAEKPHRSDSLEQDVDVERRALAEVHRVRIEERLRRLFFPRRADR